MSNMEMEEGPLGWPQTGIHHPEESVTITGATTGVKVPVDKDKVLGQGRTLQRNKKISMRKPESLISEKKFLQQSYDKRKMPKCIRNRIARLELVGEYMMIKEMELHDDGLKSSAD